MVPTTGQELNQNSKNEIIQSIKEIIKYVLKSPQEFKILNEKIKNFVKNILK